MSVFQVPQKKLFIKTKVYLNFQWISDQASDSTNNCSEKP